MITNFYVACRFIFPICEELIKINFCKYTHHSLLLISEIIFSWLFFWKVISTYRVRREVMSIYRCRLLKVLSPPFFYRGNIKIHRSKVTMFYYYTKKRQRPCLTAFKEYNLKLKNLSPWRLNLTIYMVILTYKSWTIEPSLSPWRLNSTIWSF